MRMELRVCQHCLDGDHDNEHKTAILNDLVRCAEKIQEYQDAIDLDEVVVRRVTEDEPGKPEALPVVAATIESDQMALTDTQLVTEDDDGYMLLYPNPQDVLTVLVKNVERIDEQLDNEEVTVSLSEEGKQLLSTQPQDQHEHQH